MEIASTSDRSSEMSSEVSSADERSDNERSADGDEKGGATERNSHNRKSHQQKDKEGSIHVSKTFAPESPTTETISSMHYDEGTQLEVFDVEVLENWKITEFDKQQNNLQDRMDVPYHFLAKLHFLRQ